MKRLGLLAIFVFVSGCATTKHARPVPEQVEPSVTMEPGPPAAGQGIVTLDVVDGPTHADLILSESRTSARSTYYGGALGFGYSPYSHPADPFYAGPYGSGIYPGGLTYWPGVSETEAHGVQARFLCQTPCRVNLPYGSYRLQLKLVGSKRAADRDGTLTVAEQASIFRRALTLRDDKPGLQFSGVVFTAIGWVGAATLAPGIAHGVYNIRRNAAIGGTAALVSVGVAGIVMLVKGRTVITPGSQVQWTKEAVQKPPEPAEVLNSGSKAVPVTPAATPNKKP